MNTPPERGSDALQETQMLLINRLCNDFEADWQAGRQPSLEEALKDLTGADWQAALHDLLPLEIEYRQRAGQSTTLEEYAARFPNADRAWLAGLLDPTRIGTSGASAPLPVPDVLGDYQIIGRIGSGGMGMVYKALHVRMGRFVALKVLRAEIQQNPVLIQRFDREVRAVARLTHPNIVAALDAREQDGLHFLITEFIDGMDLEATVRADGPLPVDIAVSCVLQAARGLDYAHRQGVVHRDIKPANLLRDQFGVVKVLDMGLARLDADNSTTATELTNSGMVLGTAAYMAPEQARDVRRADARSDIYSLGCTLYYLLIGRPAFTGATALDTVMSHISQPVPSLIEADASIPPALERIFCRMVAKDSADRFQSAAEVVAALEAMQLAPDAMPHTAIASRDGALEPVDPTLATLSAEKPSDLSGKKAPRTGRLNLSGHWRWAIALLAVVVLIELIFAVFKDRGQNHPGVGRYALSFNGTSSYLAVPTLTPVAGETYTLEALAEPSGNRISNVISWLGPDWMALYHTDGCWGLARRFKGESFLIKSDNPAKLGVTVHLAGVLRGKELQLFVDGQPAPSQPSTFTLAESTGGLYIGGVPLDRLPEGQNNRFFEGRIHTVRISRGVRYSKPFAPPRTFPPDTDTLALYHFHLGTGSVVPDASGNGHAAEIHDATWSLNSP